MFAAYKLKTLESGIFNLKLKMVYYEPRKLVLHFPNSISLYPYQERAKQIGKALWDGKNSTVPCF